MDRFFSSKTDRIGKTKPFFWTLLLVALVLRIWGIQCGLPYEYHGDEAFIIMHALKFGTGDLNPHWFVYPTLEMYILFMVYALYFIFGYLTGIFHGVKDLAIQYFTDPTWFFILARAISAFSAVLTVLFVYLIGKKIFDSRVGLLGAFFLSFSPLHVLHSHSAKPDILMVFLLMVSFYFSMKVFLEAKTKDYLLAGLFSGLAASTKYPGAIGIIGLIAANFLRGSQYKNFRLVDFFDKRVFFAVFFLPIGFLIGTPFALLDFSTFSNFIAGHYQQSKIGWLGTEGLGGVWSKVFTDYLLQALGLLVEIGSISGLAYYLLKRERKVILIGTVPVVFYLLMARSNLSFAHYWLPTLPFLVLIAAKLVIDIIDRLPIASTARPIMIFAIGTLFIIQPAFSSSMSNYTLSEKGTRAMAKEWIEQNILFGARIVLEKSSPRLNPNRQSIVYERERKLMQLTQGKTKEHESYNISGREPKGNLSVYYDLLMSLPTSERSYYIYSTWSAGEKALEEWRREGFSYIVTAGSHRGYLARPDKYPNVVRFYNDLDRNGILLKEFKPNEANPFDLPIRIYKID